MRLTMTVPMIILAAIVVLSLARRGENESVMVSADPPYHATLDTVAANSAAVVQGTVVGNTGKFDVPGTESVYAYDVFAFRVDKVLGQVDATGIRPGDVIQVGMAAMSSQPPDIGNLAEVRAEIEGYTGSLEVGSALTLFVAPFRFSASVTGWAIVSGDYGVLQQDRAVLRSRAPRGPLASTAVSETNLVPVLRSLGARPAPVPGSENGPNGRTIQTPATGPR